MKRLLIIIDMQMDFVDGALGTKEAKDLVPMVKNKIEEYRKMQSDIIFTKDTHSENYFNTQEGKKLPVKHCIKGTKGHELCMILKKYENDYSVYEKNTFGCKELVLDLQNKDYDEIELCGVCTDICVISNALLIKAFLPEVKIIVNKDFCAGTTKENHERALNAMKICQIDVK